MYEADYTLTARIPLNENSKAVADAILAALEAKALYGAENYDRVFCENDYYDFESIGFAELDCYGSGGCIWPYMETDMVSLSKEFPDVTFRIYGIGCDDCVDIWYNYFKNGEDEFCPFEPKKPEYIKWEE